MPGNNKDTNIPIISQETALETTNITSVSFNTNQAAAKPHPLNLISIKNELSINLFLLNSIAFIF